MTARCSNSFGHPVPLVAGRLQRPGADARGRVLKTQFTDTSDTLSLDIASAYSIPELKRLERTFVYSRGGEGTLEVRDEVVFTKPQKFGTALITFGEWQRIGQDKLLIQDGDAAVQVQLTAGGGELEIVSEEIHEDLAAKRVPTRIGINFKEPVTQGSITVTLCSDPKRRSRDQRATSRRSDRGGRSARRHGSDLNLARRSQRAEDSLGDGEGEAAAIGRIVEPGGIVPVGEESAFNQDGGLWMADEHDEVAVDAGHGR